MTATIDPATTITPVTARSASSSQDQTTPTTKLLSTANDRSSSGSPTAGDDKCPRDSKKPSVAPGSNIPDDKSSADSKPRCVAGDQTSGGDNSMFDSKSHHVAPGPALDDPILGILAEVVDDLETVRTANENRLRSLTDPTIHGLTIDHPDVAQLQTLVDSLRGAEHQGVLNLKRRVRKHPLWAVVKDERGVGEKQFGRLLAVIGDPSWHDRDDRPRKRRELRAYCGVHVLLQTPGDDNRLCESKDSPVVTGPDISGHDNLSLDSKWRNVVPADPTSGHDNDGVDSKKRAVVAGPDNHPRHDNCRRDSNATPVVAGVAPKRARGQKSNWNEDARKRLWLIADKIIMLNSGKYRGTVTPSKYLGFYDATRAKNTDAVHQFPCVRCGPKGKPAQPGSPLSLGHQHARGLRKVMCELLTDLFREAQRLHGYPPQDQPGDNCRHDSKASPVVGLSNLPDDKTRCDSKKSLVVGDQTSPATSEKAEAIGAPSPGPKLPDDNAVPGSNIARVVGD